MLDKIIRKKWEKFIDKYREYFLDNKIEWKKKIIIIENYIDKYNKIPSTVDNNPDIKKMGNFISNQIKNYNNNMYIMKDNDIKKTWECFIKKYQKYFLSNKEKWMNVLVKLKIYIDNNKKLPSEHDKNNEINFLGKWIGHQKLNYNKKYGLMKENIIFEEWEKFINDEKYKKYFISNNMLWYDNFNQIKIYIDKYDKRPSSEDKDNNVKKLGQWIQDQSKNYKNRNKIMKNDDIYLEWTKFINDEKYKKYFISNEDIWKNNLKNVKIYINKNKKKPYECNKDKTISYLGKWIYMQLSLYNKKDRIMKDPEIRKLWEEFITEYQQYFSNNSAIKEKQPDKKLTIIKQKEDKPKETDKEKRERIQSEYQELTKKMSIQKSDKTNEMFKEDPKLWHQYHDNRDFSFKGYNNQDEIPVNKIISYLEERSNKKLKILDLGCGRNIIKKHFEDNKKFEIIGYDHVSFNGSIACDISNLPDEDEAVDICIFSQSLMGSNWKKYIDEAVRVLRYNGEMIVSESVERYEKIKEYINKLGLHIKQDNYVETNRWFYLHVLNYKVNEKGCDK
jgi:ribosomal RNA-processing protein 8